VKGASKLASDQRNHETCIGFAKALLVKVESLLASNQTTTKLALGLNKFGCLTFGLLHSYNQHDHETWIKFEQARLVKGGLPLSC